MNKFETENDLRLTIKAQEKEVLVDETCCTSVNIILKNDGQIMTSFLGAHNPEIIKNLEKALKMYFKGIKKTLKEKYVESDECCCGDEHCHGECHDHKCTCGEECTCGTECHCHDEEADHQHEDHCHCGCDKHSKKDPHKSKSKEPVEKSSKKCGSSKTTKQDKKK